MTPPIKLTPHQRADLIAALATQQRDGPYALSGEYRSLELKGLVTSKLDGRRVLYTLTRPGVALAERLAADDSIELASPRGGISRTGKPGAKPVKVRFDASERAQLEAFLEREGGTMSDWVRLGLKQVGALR